MMGVTIIGCPDKKGWCDGPDNDINEDGNGDVGMEGVVGFIFVLP